MRSIKIALGVGMAMCLLIFAVSSASAVQWEHCAKVGKPKGSFSEHKCLTGEAGGEWEWLVIKEKEKENVVSSTAKQDGKGAALTLVDKKGNLGAEVIIECEGTDKGTVTGPDKDEITAITATACKTIKGPKCEGKGEPKAAAVHLPWATILETVEGKTRDKISGTGAGNPGWVVTCTVFGIEVKDECTSATTSTGMANNATLSLVEATFDAKSSKAKCSVPNAESGEVKGTDTITQENGWGLRFK